MCIFFGILLFFLLGVSLSIITMCVIVCVFALYSPCFVNLPLFSFFHLLGREKEKDKRERKGKKGKDRRTILKSSNTDPRVKDDRA